MSKILWKVLLVSPALIGVSLAVSAAALADSAVKIGAVTQAQDGQAIAQFDAKTDFDNVDGVLGTEESRGELAIAPQAPLSLENINQEKVATTQAGKSAIAPQPQPLEIPADNLSAELFTPSVHSQVPNPEPAPTSTVLEQVNQYSSEDGVNNEPVGQVTSVSQLSDVQPTDWAFQALQSLVERYGCIAGYPDGTYRGNRAMTRYEFAAGLNACLERINELIGAGTTNLVKREDLLALQKLQEEFAAELATLRGRVDALEARTAELEANQFSTTTKLNGEVIFGVAGIAAGDNANGREIDTSTVFGSRVRLNFDTSFSGEDLLRTRLQVTNLGSFSTNSTFTPEGELRFNAGPFAEASNTVSLDALLYSFPIGKSTTVFLEANAGAPDDFTNTVNPFFDGDGATGALSNFGTRNPIYYQVGGAGIGIRHQFGDRLELSLGFLASDAASPQQGAGLFNGPYGAIAQLTFTPSKTFALGLTYVNSYGVTTGTGSNAANFPSRLDYFGINTDKTLPVSSNSYGLEASWQLGKRFALGGWVGYTAQRTLSTLGGSIERGDQKIWNWAVTLAFPDLLKEGNLAGILVGMEPKVTSTSTDDLPEDKDTSLHVEAFYQFKLNDNISITPGIIWLTAPDHNNDNSDLLIGVVRTTFTF
ncbi:iron uptake porin [Kamptonema sp. UHCC 0994]|uniref:iron uptake porin n=1 Tax=Kamptonema sp. UHCC 0994 TaxID=3031329 RepID=UPI0023B986F0|nr:iron uptake porin [Kamptonema sp. UHCC 0994]MDF0551538.1 iron uptake porin [Kamptonema sp. UHCC 0994]